MTQKCQQRNTELFTRRPLNMLHLGPASLITKFGYLAVAAIVGLESVGLPLPGEATLIAAAVYAGTTQRLNIWLVIACASLGAILGDNLGFWIGTRTRLSTADTLGKLRRPHGEPDQSRSISVSAAWREDRLFRPLLCGVADLGGPFGWCQPNGVAKVSSVQRRRGSSLGRNIWPGRLLPWACTRKFHKACGNSPRDNRPVDSDCAATFYQATRSRTRCSGRSRIARTTNATQAEASTR